MTLDRISAGDEVPERVNVVIEVTRGSRARYEYDRNLGAFALVAALGEGEGWPADYGFVPSTVSQDGHPLDALVLTAEPTFPGCVVPCRPVGVLNLTDGERSDHKILAVPVAEPGTEDIREIADLPEGTVDRITAFFTAHPTVSGQEESVEGWDDAESARDVIFKAWEGFLV
jgi:inorganic pyrophosphatase